MLFPFAFAFAETEIIEAPPPPPPGFHPGVVQYRESDLNFMHGMMNAGDENDASSTNPWRSATSTPPYLNGEKNGLLKHFGTTTPPGMMREHATTSDENASTTDKGPKGGLHMGVPFFLQWLFGLPATTTIGELRDELSSTTASTTPPAPPRGFGGFLKDFFGGLGRFFGSN